jgi:transketolase
MMFNPSGLIVLQFQRRLQPYAPASGVAHGAYVLADSPSKTPEVIFIATGKELQTKFGFEPEQLVTAAKGLLNL